MLCTLEFSSFVPFPGKASQNCTLKVNSDNFGCVGASEWLFRRSSKLQSDGRNCNSRLPHEPPQPADRTYTPILAHGDVRIPVVRDLAHDDVRTPAI